MTERVFYYVRHCDVAERLKEGWTIAADLGPPHCFYSVLMEAPPDRKNKFARIVDFVLATLRIRATKRNRR